MYKTFEQINVRSIVQNHWKKGMDESWYEKMEKYMYKIFEHIWSACRIFWDKIFELDMQKRVKLSWTSPHWLWLALRTDHRLMRK